MPISSERRALYPANWSTEIRPRILARANNMCERCLVANHARVFRFNDGGDGDSSGASYMYECGAVFCAETGLSYGYARITDLPAGRFVDIVVTIAHVHDPDPGNCADDNLAAWCQRCHNLHDLPMRRQNAAATRRAKSPTPDLFDIRERLS